MDSKVMVKNTIQSMVRILNTIKSAYRWWYQKLLNKIKRRDTQDHISDLPDHILISILDLLPLKCAIQTSVLSSHWKYLWTLSSNLILDVDHKVKESDVAKYVDGFFGLFKLHKEIKVKKIRFGFSLTYELSLNVKKWIKLAMTMRLQELQLNCFQNHLNYRVQFPFESLKLSQCTAFSSLKTICLRYVVISDEGLLWLISSLEVIESIRLERCFGFRNLRLKSPTRSLRSLIVKHCSFNLMRVEINAPNLLSFKFKGDQPIDALHMSVPSILHASLVYYRPILGQDINLDITHANSLTISDFFLENITAGGNCLQFTNLKEAKILLHNMLKPMFISIDILLRRSPHLMKLIIPVRRICVHWERRDKNAWARPPPCLVHNLRMIEITWYDRDDEELELVEFLLKSSKVLESMIIYIHTVIRADTLERIRAFRRASKDAKITFLR